MGKKKEDQSEERGQWDVSTHGEPPAGQEDHYEVIGNE